VAEPGTARPGRRGRLRAWLDHRVGLSGLRHVVEDKAVPVHRHGAWYYFGGMTLFFFLVQVSTGILLMLYYRPSSEEAYESVQFLVTQVPFGWLVRSIHSWSANLMIAAAFVHLFSVLFLKAYRPPRELTWLSGFALFALALGFGFSGYLLPWNKLAYFATRVGTDIASALPIVGSAMVRFLRGGDHVTGGTLSRFYGWHVAILPALAASFLALHLLLVQRHGMSVPPSIEREKPRGTRTMRFVPDFLLRDLFGWTLALGVLAALAALYPWELGEKADAFAPAPADIRPEWYFMFMFQTLKLVPGGEIAGIENEAIAILAFGAVGAAAFALPFLDRGIVARGRSPLVTALAAAALTFVVVLTAIGYHAWWPVWAGTILGLGPWLAGRAMAGTPEDRP
jgi:cytochrome b6